MWYLCKPDCLFSEHVFAPGRNVLSLVHVTYPSLSRLPYDGLRFLFCFCLVSLIFGIKVMDWKITTGQGGVLYRRVIIWSMGGANRSFMYMKSKFCLCKSASLCHMLMRWRQGHSNLGVTSDVPTNLRGGYSCLSSSCLCKQHVKVRRQCLAMRPMDGSHD